MLLNIYNGNSKNEINSKNSKSEINNLGLSGRKFSGVKLSYETLIGEVHIGNRQTRLPMLY